MNATTENLILKIKELNEDLDLLLDEGIYQLMLINSDEFQEYGINKGNSYEEFMQASFGDSAYFLDDFQNLDSAMALYNSLEPSNNKTLVLVNDETEKSVCYKVA